MPGEKQQKGEFGVVIEDGRTSQQIIIGIECMVRLMGLKKSVSKQLMKWMN